MKTIMLYGFLGKRFGRVHRYAVETPAEAIRALSTTIDGFKQAIVDGGSYRVLVSGRDSLELEQTLNPVSDKETIRIVPAVQGSGSFGRIILGAALIGVSFAFPGAGAFELAGKSFSLSGIAGNIGFSLVLGGVSQLLFSPPGAPEPSERPESKPSFIFQGAINTSKQGNAVPICYGEMIVGSQVISAGLSVEDIAV